MKKKSTDYKDLLKRVELSIKSEFYLEAAWIVSTIIEDRLVSLLKNSGGHLKPNGNEIRMIGPKVIELQSRLSTVSDLRKVIYDDILDLTNTWKDNRNVLMHALAENGSYQDFFKDIYLLANKGEDLAKQLCTRARKLKRLTK